MDIAPGDYQFEAEKARPGTGGRAATQAGLAVLIRRFTSASAPQSVSLSYPFSTRAFISEYAVSMRLISAAAFVVFPRLIFTLRMYLPIPSKPRPRSARPPPLYNPTST